MKKSNNKTFEEIMDLSHEILSLMIFQDVITDQPQTMFEAWEKSVKVQKLLSDISDIACKINAIAYKNL